MKILMPLPLTDFDPTESGVPWHILTQNGVSVFFATSTGAVANCDDRMLNGTGLGLLKSVLAADKHGKSAYLKMAESKEFKAPLVWKDLNAKDFDGIVLAGGHAPGMREYLESEVLQKLVSGFFEPNKPVGAICHGVVLAARSTRSDGKSVLFGRKTTSLLESQEMAAWNLTRLWLGGYYRTYPQTVESEVKAALSKKTDFIRGPTPLLRDRPDKLNRGFVVQDSNYLSARWPGDAHKFASGFLKLLKS